MVLPVHACLDSMLYPDRGAHMLGQTSHNTINQNFQAFHPIGHLGFGRQVRSRVVANWIM